MGGPQANDSNMAKKFRIPGMTKFSWKRALGVTAAKQRFARATGIPTTAAGRRRKFGNFGLNYLLRPSRRSPQYVATGGAPAGGVGGCLVALVVIFIVMPVVLVGVALAGIIGLGVLAAQFAPATPDNSKPIAAAASPAKPAAEPVKKIEAKPIVAKSPDPPLASRRTVEPAPEPASKPTPESESPFKPAPTMRTWTSAAGGHTTEAEFVSMGAGKVKLRKPDGTVITLDADKVSAADREWIRKRDKH